LDRQHRKDHASVYYDPESKWPPPGGPERRLTGQFATLAAATGFSTRDCAVLAATNRLNALVVLYEQRRAARSRPSVARPLSGALALLQVRERMDRDRLARPVSGPVG
jgi:hypothetical protein